MANRKSKSKRKKNLVKSRRKSRLEAAKNSAGLTYYIIMIIVALVSLFSLTLLWMKLKPLLDYLDSLSNSTTLPSLVFSILKLLLMF
ncbi:MAG: hypothetical protein ACTSRP_17260 [Candidatus Helarchaeota archaeon]